MKYNAIVSAYVRYRRQDAQAELDWFRAQPTLQQTIEFASLATDRSGKRLNHQRRLKRTALEQSRCVLLTNTKVVQLSRTFDDLFHFIESSVGSIYGIGELYVYDTALRIGAKLGMQPTKVYLHAGTRHGARALGFAGKRESLDVAELPRAFQCLEPHEIEDVLCIFKSDFDKPSRSSVQARLRTLNCNNSRGGETY